MITALQPLADSGEVFNVCKYATNCTLDIICGNYKSLNILKHKEALQSICSMHYYRAGFRVYLLSFDCNCPDLQASSQAALMGHIYTYRHL